MCLPCKSSTTVVQEIAEKTHSLQELQYKVFHSAHINIANSEIIIIKPYEFLQKYFFIIFTEITPGFISFLMETLLYFYSADDHHVTFLWFTTLIYKLFLF